jgi:glycosyltransferase involved in cell wall biosynthesis
MQEIDLVVCAKNNEKTIGQSLRRILTYALPHRLIVIDGQSHDRTGDIAVAHGAEVYSDNGRGLGYARNMALKLAGTTIMGFVDADAYIQSNWREMLKHFEDPTVAATSACTIYGYGNPPLQRFHEWMSKAGGHDIGFVSTLIRTESVVGVGGIREDLSAYEDWELYGRLESRGYRWISDKNVSVFHPQSLGEHLSHARHWGAGAARSNVSERRFIRAFVLSPYWGLRLAFIVHPILSLYYPVLRLSYLRGYAEGAKLD